MTSHEDDKHYHPLTFGWIFFVGHSCLNKVFLTQSPILLRVIERMVKDRSVAEDLLQEAWLRVNRAVDERTVEHLKPFIFQTARNLARDYLRARRVRLQILVEDAPSAQILSVASPTGLPEDSLHASRILTHLSHSLSGLSTRQQQIFVLSRLQGCSHEEIATRLNVSQSTVQKELKLVMTICIGVASRLEES